ncbi:MAG: thymidine phosphorylase [Bacteroidetes bacterium]|nr:thymidine phosphorylase [Bacteroidota bacterium]
MNTVDLIRKKRNGESLSEDEMRFLIHGYVHGSIPEYQMSAFLMAVYFRGMSDEETLTFTRLMLDSGKRIDLTDIPGRKVDKHSTGGVGDKVSLILAPLVASCKVPVPMISGRGLGHTGGTLDKLESIPGFRTTLTLEEYRNIIQRIGVVMMGQTSEIAPADKKMYALRDVTATVECIPLIAGSIMSKKLAEGIDALVLDIKTGRGAFMETYEKAIDLGTTLVKIGNGFGVRTIGFVTDMNEPLGIAVGNWLEVVESVHCLQGKRGRSDHSADLMEVTYTLSGAMVYLGGKANSIEEGIQVCRESIDSGRAYSKFLELVEAQGGDVESIENLSSYPLSTNIVEVKSPKGGFIQEIDSFELGQVSILLGAGRTKLDDPIDMKAGIVLRKKVGDSVMQGEPLAVLYTDKDSVVTEARHRVAQAYTITAVPSSRTSRIISMIDMEGVHPFN